VSFECGSFGGSFDWGGHFFIRDERFVFDSKNLFCIIIIDDIILHCDAIILAVVGLQKCRQTILDIVSSSFLDSFLFQQVLDFFVV
jgi:hypothetical protein